MNIEIIGFYPIELNEAKELLNGTLRIKLPDIGIHILGVFVSKRNGSWFFSLPGRKSEHHETGEQIRYPFIVFENRDQQKDLMAAIREKAPIFIEKRLADTENPLIFPERQKKEEKNPLPQKVKNNATEAKATAIPQTSRKVWQDLPKRIQNTPRGKIY